MNNNELHFQCEFTPGTDWQMIKSISTLRVHLTQSKNESGPLRVAAVMNNSNCSVARLLCAFANWHLLPHTCHMTLQLCPHVPRVTTSVRIMPAFDQSPWLFPNDLIILPQIATYYEAILIRQFSCENCSALRLISALTFYCAAAG